MAFCTAIFANCLRTELTSDALKHFTFRTFSHTLKNSWGSAAFAAFRFITRTAHSVCAQAHYHFPRQVQHIAQGKTQWMLIKWWKRWGNQRLRLNVKMHRTSDLDLSRCFFVRSRCLRIFLTITNCILMTLMCLCVELIWFYGHCYSCHLAFVVLFFGFCIQITWFWWERNGWRCCCCCSGRHFGKSCTFNSWMNYRAF